MMAIPIPRHKEILYPFDLKADEVRDLWRSWFSKNSEEVTEKYGQAHYVGRSIDHSAGMKKMFTGTMVSAKVIDPQTIVFTMGSKIGIDRIIDSYPITATIDNDGLKFFIETHKQKVAERTYVKRFIAEQEAIKAAAISVVYAELWGDTVRPAAPPDFETQTFDVEGPGISIQAKVKFSGTSLGLVRSALKTLEQNIKDATGEAE